MFVIERHEIFLLPLGIICGMLGSFIIKTGMIKYVFNSNLFYVLAFILGFITVVLVRIGIAYFKESKKKVFLEKIMGDIAKTHYKNEYNKDIDIIKIQIFSSQCFPIKRFTNSGIVYFEENKSVQVIVALDSNFCLDNITDNFPDKKSLDLENRLRAILKKSDILES